MARFICRFAVGRDGLVYSAVWRVWTARNKPDLYIAVRAIAGELKGTVHAPCPPSHLGWERHFGFPMDAASVVSREAKRHGGPHHVRWTGCNIGPDTMVEYRVIIRGTSLEEAGQAVRNDVVLLPMPSRDEYVEVVVILGPKGPTLGYPRAQDGETCLLGEGRMSDDRRVWVVYTVKPIEKSVTTNSIESSPITPDNTFIDANADLSNARLRGIVYGAQSDGTLAFWDMKAAIKREAEKG